MKYRKKRTVFLAFLLVSLFSFSMIPAGQTVSEEKASTLDPITDLDLCWIGLSIPDYPGDRPEIAAGVKNIGDTPVGEYWVHYELRGLFFPRTVSYVAVKSSGLLPGWVRVFLFENTDYLPKFGIFQFTCEVNRNREVPEDNYDNNMKTINLMAIFGFWRTI